MVMVMMVNHPQPNLMVNLMPIATHLMPAFIVYIGPHMAEPHGGP
jgi:hypothetical protein